MRFKKLGICTLASLMVLGCLAGCTTNGKTDKDTDNKKIENVVTMESQTLGLEKVDNARQLGGYYTQDGRKVKANMLLRSGKLINATEDDIAKLTDTYNLGTIVDLRTTSEIEQAPNPTIDGVEDIHVRILNEDTPTDANSAAMTKIYGSDPVDALIGMATDGTLSDDMYITTINSESAKKGFAEFFQILLDNEEGKAVLWHCTGGKDRTGTAAVLLLSALGVDEDTILDDFALTNEFLKSKIDYMGAEAAKKTDDQEIIDGVRTLTGVSRDFMKKMIDYLTDEYGSVENFIIEELNVSKDDIVKLQDMYLES